MVHVLVLFYSAKAHVYQLALAVAEGARQVDGAEVVVKRVADLPHDTLQKVHALESQEQFKDVPIAEPNELGQYDCVLFGTTGRFGMMAAPMKRFLDATGGVWMTGALVGKVGSVFCSADSQHGGHESVLLSFMTYLLHQGMVVVGLPYSFAGQRAVDAVHGCSPYGASTVTGGQGECGPTAVDLEGARFQGRHATAIAARLVRRRLDPLPDGPPP
eukprot:EG_transcript_21640